MKKILFAVAAITAAVPAMAGIGSQSASKLALENVVKAKSDLTLLRPKQDYKPVTKADYTEFNAQTAHIKEVAQELKNRKAARQVPQPLAEAQSMRAGVRLPMAATPTDQPHMDGQWEQPFQAYGGLRLRQYDTFVGNDESNATLQAGTTFFYDDQGNCIGSEEIGVESVDHNGQAKLFKSITEYKDGTNTNLTYHQDKNGDYYLTSKNTRTYNSAGQTVAGETWDWDYDKKELYQTYNLESQTDDQGRIVTSTVSMYNYVKEQLLPYNRFDYTYDEEGIPTQTTYIFSDQGEWNPSTKQINYRYPDKNAYLYEYSYCNQYSHVWYHYNRTYSEYDDNDNPVLIIDWKYDDQSEAWIYSEKRTYLYNAAGENTSNRIYEWKDGDWAISQDKGYEYQNDTICIADWQVDFYISGPYGYKSSYTLDQFGRETTHISYSVNGVDPLTWTPVTKNEYTYDDQTGSDVNYNTNVEYSWNGSDWTPQYQTITRYDSQGYQYYNEYLRWVDGGWKVSSRNVNQKIYNQQGEGHTILYEYITGSWGMRTVSDYDANFNLILEDNYDYVSGEWIMKSHYTCKYDSQDRILEELFSQTSDGINWESSRQVYSDLGQQTYAAYGEDYDNPTWYMTSYSILQYSSTGKITKLEIKEGYFDKSPEDGESYVTFYEGIRFELSYDANDSVILRKNYSLNTETDEWGLDSQSEIEYGQTQMGNRIVNEKVYYYNYGEEQLELAQETRYTYTATTILEETYEWRYNEEAEEDQFTVIGKKETTFGFDGPDSYRIDQWEWPEWGYKLDLQSRYENRKANGGTQQDWFVWDSSENKWVPSNREVMTKDATTGLVNVESYSYNEYEEAMIGITREEYIIDDHDQFTFKQDYKWDGTAKNWVPKNKSEYAFKYYLLEDGTYGYYTLLEKSMTWNASLGIWIGNYWTENDYDDNGYNTMYAMYNWNSNTNEWEGNFKNISQLDDSLNEVLRESYDGWENGDWRGSYKVVKLFDSNNYEILEEDYSWSSDRHAWYGTYKSEMAYDENGNHIMDASYNWDSDSCCWVGAWKDITTVEDGVNVYENYSWNRETNSWEGDNRRKHIYISDEYSYTDIDYEYRWSEDHWVGYQAKTYSAAFRKDFNQDYYLEKDEYFDENSNQWLGSIYQKSIYRYTESTNVKFPTMLSATIRVNDGVISVACAGQQITIFTLGGAQIAAGQDNVSVSVAPGTYVLTIDGASTKLIVK